MSQRDRRRWPERLLGLRNRALFTLDLVTLPLAAYLAFVLRLEPAGLATPRYGPALLTYVLLAPAVKIPIFYVFAGYSRYWPFASLPDVQAIIAAAAAGELVAGAAALLLERLIGFPPMPRSIPFIAVFLTAAALGLPRYALRLLNARTSRHVAKAGPARRVLIAGAGEGGHVVLREIQRNPQMGLHVVGFVDDDPTKQGLHIQDVRILGAVDEIPDLVKQYRIQRVLIAIPTATGQEIRRIVTACHRARVEVRTLPGVFELIDGGVEIRRFRPVQVEDLLAR